GIDHRRVEREYALDTFAIGDLADGKAFLQTAAIAGDADAFIGLNAGALAFDDLDVHDDRVAGLKLRNVLASGKAGNFFLLDSLNQVHNRSPRAPFGTHLALA